VVARLWAESDEDADDQLELIQRGIRQEGARVIVRAPAIVRPGLLLFFGHGPRIDYQLTAPRASAGRIVNRSGRINVDDLKGPLEVEARSGRVTLSRIGADTTIVSRSGIVQAEGIAGSLAIDSRSGRVTARSCERDVTVNSRSGTVQIEGVGGTLKVENRSGTIAVRDVGGAVTIACRSGAVRYDGAVRGDFDINVTSGMVRLAVDADSSFFLDAESLSGGVHSDLPLRRPAGAAPSGPRPTVRVRTISGVIRVGPR